MYRQGQGGAQRSESVFLLIPQNDGITFWIKPMA